jgi:hypothetical protein
VPASKMHNGLTIFVFLATIVALCLPLGLCADLDGLDHSLRDALNSAIAQSKADGSWASKLTKNIASAAFLPGDCISDPSVFRWPMRESGTHLDKILKSGKIVKSPGTPSLLQNPLEAELDALGDYLIQQIGAHYGVTLHVSNVSCSVAAGNSDSLFESDLIITKRVSGDNREWLG